MEFLQLFNQLVNKFKVAVKDLLVKVFCPLMDKVFALLPKDGPLEGSGINTEVKNWHFLVVKEDVMA